MINKKSQQLNFNRFIGAGLATNGLASAGVGVSLSTVSLPFNTSYKLNSSLSTVSLYKSYTSSLLIKMLPIRPYVYINNVFISSSRVKKPRSLHPLKSCTRSYYSLARSRQHRITLTCLRIKAYEILKRSSGGIKQAIEEVANIAKKEAPIIAGASGSRPSSPINPHNLSRDPQLQPTPQNPHTSPAKQPVSQNSPKVTGHIKEPLKDVPSIADKVIKNRQDLVNSPQSMSALVEKIKQDTVREPFISTHSELYRQITTTLETQVSNTSLETSTDDQETSSTNKPQDSSDDTKDNSETPVTGIVPDSSLSSKVPDVVDTNPKALIHSDQSIQQIFNRLENKIDTISDNIKEIRKRQDEQEKYQKEKEEKDTSDQKEKALDPFALMGIALVAGALTTDIAVNPDKYANTSEKEKNPFSDTKDVLPSSHISSESPESKPKQQTSQGPMSRQDVTNEIVKMKQVKHYETVKVNKKDIKPNNEEVD